MAQENFTSRNENHRPLIILDHKTAGQFYAPLRHLFFGFDSQGVICCIVAPSKSQMEAFLLPTRNMVVEYPIINSALFYRQNRRLLISQVEKFKPTVVHCFGTGRASVAKMIAHRFNIPAILTVNSVSLNLFHRQAIKGFSTLILPSSRVADGIKRYIVGGVNIKQINFGTFVDETCACFSQSQRIAGIVVISETLHFTALEPLLTAIRHLATDGFEFVVALMSSDSVHKDVRRFIHGVGLESVVYLLPVMRPLRTVFRGTDILVHPFVESGFSPVILEAASAGTAIATDKNNADDFLRNGVTSVFFDSSDELTIYSALQRLLGDREFAKSLAIAAQNYLRNNHSVSSMVDNLIQVYSQATSSIKS